LASSISCAIPGWGVVSAPTRSRSPVYGAGYRRASLRSPQWSVLPASHADARYPSGGMRSHAPSEVITMMPRFERCEYLSRRVIRQITTANVGYRIGYGCDRQQEKQTIACGRVRHPRTAKDEPPKTIINRHRWSQQNGDSRAGLCHYTAQIGVCPHALAKGQLGQLMG